MPLLEFFLGAIEPAQIRTDGPFAIRAAVVDANVLAEVDKHPAAAADMLAKYPSGCSFESESEYAKCGSFAPAIRAEIGKKP